MMLLVLSAKRIRPCPERANTVSSAIGLSLVGWVVVSGTTSTLWQDNPGCSRGFQDLEALYFGALSRAGTRLIRDLMAVNRGCQASEELRLVPLDLEMMLDFVDAGGGTRTRTRVTPQEILSSTERCPPTSIANDFVHWPVQFFWFHPPMSKPVAVNLAVKNLAPRVLIIVALGMGRFENRRRWFGLSLSGGRRK